MLGAEAALAEERISARRFGARRSRGAVQFFSRFERLKI
jgi:hypothetical protein